MGNSGPRQLTTSLEAKEEIRNKVPNILTNRNLIINADKNRERSTASVEHQTKAGKTATI